MPLIKSAIKKLRQDRKKEKIRDQFRKELDKSVKKANKEKKADLVKKAISLVDKAVKKNIIHKNKGARIKSGLSKLAKPTASEAKKEIPKQKIVAQAKTSKAKSSKAKSPKIKTTKSKNHK
ncbi:30S ribosomal protein S20 [Candidatus Parcubacteria bacterium]|nr:MAG: 30S ribosomal protein S20 [Candidatus Parcubacteria bacterium]